MHLLAMGLLWVIIVFVVAFFVSTIASGTNCLIRHLLLRKVGRVWGIVVVIAMVIVWAATAYDLPWLLVVIATLMPLLILGMDCAEEHYDKQGKLVLKGD